MEPFRRLAFFTVARDAGFVALVAATLMLAFSFEPALAFLIGANVALAFCLGLVLRAWRLRDAAERIVWTEPWRVLDAKERPVGETGRLWARDLLAECWLRTARGAALAAIVMSGSSLTVSAVGSRVSDISPDVTAHAITHHPGRMPTGLMSRPHG